MLLEALGVLVVVATMWAALQFEGTPGTEGGAASDEGGLLARETPFVGQIPESQTT